jgi:uncharacterized protein (DUF1330 family)
VSHAASIEPTSEQLERLASASGRGPIVMVNLLRFKDRAGPPDEGLSGAEAYRLYAAAIPPFLARVGGRLVAAAACHESVIGPAEAEWDAVALVEYPSAEAFLAMAGNPAYLAIHVHRVAALADSRLILSTQVAAPRLAG